MKTLLLLLLSAVFLSTRLLAELSFGATPEWLAHKSELAFTGVPQHVEIIPLEEWSLTRVRFKIEKCLKGPLSAGDIITVSSVEWKDRGYGTRFREAVEKQQSVLGLASIARGDSHLVDGTYTFPNEPLMRSVFFADDEVERIYDAEGKALRDPYQVLQRIVAQIQKEKNMGNSRGLGRIREKDVEADFRSSDAGKDFGGWGSVFLKTLEYLDPASESPGSAIPEEKRIFLSLATADKALAHFSMFTLPTLEAEFGRKEKGSNILTSISKRTVSTGCHYISPDDKPRARVAGVRWPEENDLIVAGAAKRVEESTWSFWSIRYSTEDGRSLQAYVDSETGEPLLVFIIREH